MSSKYDIEHANLSLCAEFEMLLTEYCDFLCHAQIRSVTTYRGFVFHFLIWLELSNIGLGSINCAIINRFLQHQCDCRDFVCTVKINAWCKQSARSPLMWFVYFLEQSGRVNTPGELETNLRITDQFISRLRSDGYAPSTIEKYHCAANRLIVWLHIDRRRLCDLTPRLLEKFWNSKLVYSVPGIYRGHATSSTLYRHHIERFLAYMTETGQIISVQPTSNEALIPPVLERFQVWLRRNRDVSEQTISVYTKGIAKITAELGENPEVYEVGLIRDVFFQQIENRSQSHARCVATLLRLYLQCLASEGCVPASLINAVPKVARWRLSTLPRYISDDDVECTIKCCAGNKRDKAILLLLARLALRAGDIVSLCLSDIDWNQAQIHLSGKSRHHTALPLPQDVGDALYEYIATARPKSDEQQVFLGSRAPYRPFARSVVVSSIVRRAFDRAGVVTVAGRGAHVFRHSQATSLLRSGTSLSTIQTLLRHKSSDTTMIYAKTDVVMLQEVAQPWVGGTEQ